MLRGFASRAKAFRRDRRGATAVEYGLLLAGIAVALILSAQTFAGEVTRLQNEVVDALATAETADDE